MSPKFTLMFQIETIEPDKVRTIEELNKDYAEKILEMYGDNKSKAAEVLGISRTSLWRILKEASSPAFGILHQEAYLTHLLSAVVP